MAQLLVCHLDFTSSAVASEENVEQGSSQYGLPLCLFYVYGCFACMFVCVSQVCSIPRLEEGVRAPGTKVTNSVGHLGKTI